MSGLDDRQNSKDHAAELRAIIERLERLEEEKRALSEDIKEVKAEAKARGFNVKSIVRVVKERGETEVQRIEREDAEAQADIYRAALGMLGGTPLGDAARKRLDRLELADRDVRAELGRIAAREGKRVIDNPFTAGDPRRAAWDEGWCQESASDGMDIPSAWRRAAKPKKPASDKDDGDAADKDEA